MKITPIIKISFFLASLLIAFTACNTAKKAATLRKQAPSVVVLSVQEQRQFSYYFTEAVRQRLAENYDVAIELLSKCYQINDQEPNVMFELANVYASIGNSDAAISYLNSAVSLDKENIWYQLNLASLYIATHDLKNATAVYEYIAQQHPEREELSYTLVELYNRQSLYQEALNELNKIEKRQGVTEEISFEKYRIYSNLRDDKKAAKEIDALINKYPQEMKYRVFRGNIYFEVGDMPRALEMYNYVLERQPDNGLARLSMAEYYEKTGEQDKALDEMYYALRSRNIEVETKIGMLDQYLSILNANDLWKDKTAGLFDVLIEIHPTVVEIRYYRAIYLMASEQIDEAQKEFETILDLDPKKLEAYDGIIRIRMNKDDMEGMLTYTQKAIEALPDIPEWYLYEGIAYAQLKEYDKALKSYQDGIDLVKDKSAKSELLSNMYAQMGDIYAQILKKDLAFESYEKSLQYNHYNTHVLNNYSYYLAVEKRDLSKAETMIKECLKMIKPNSTVLDTYAWVLFQQGYYNLAKRQIEEAIKLDEEDTNGVLMEHYGDILYKTGDVDSAVEMWQKSLEKGNDSETLLLKIEKRTYIEYLEISE
jgi:tetratricopeptide (TPR) repeat protein